MSGLVYVTPEGYELARELLLPDARSFLDVFELASVWKYGNEHAYAPVLLPAGPVGDTLEAILGLAGLPPKDPASRNEVGPYCSVQARTASWALDVVPRPAVLEAVAPRLVTPDDRLSWEIIEHSATGRALVLLQHGRIIGSHWVAYIDPATIPGRP